MLRKMLILGIQIPGNTGGAQVYLWATMKRLSAVAYDVRNQVKWSDIDVHLCTVFHVPICDRISV